MDYKEKVKNIMYDSYLKLALVNLESGEYISVKSIDSNADKYSDIEDVTEYFRSRNALYCCHPEEADEFARMCDMTYIKKLVDAGARSIVRNFRFKLNPKGDYEWIVTSIAVSEDMSGEGTWVVFGIKYTDTGALAVEDSLRMLSNSYTQIYKLNITSNTFDIIKEDKLHLGEYISGMGLKAYMEKLTSGSNIHPDDVKKLKGCFNKEFLQSYFSTKHDKLSVRYRQRINTAYRWIMTDIIPTSNFSVDNNEFYLYTQDIDKEYSEDIKNQELLKFYSYKDALTHLSNRNSFNIMCDEYARTKDKPPVGFLFNDVNKLKYVNDHFGHKEGDAYLQSVARMLSQQFGENACYRISGDEFVVVLLGIDESTFNLRVKNYLGIIGEMEEEPVSVGAVWMENPFSMDLIMNEAEKRMYEDKMRFYAKHPELKRRELDIEEKIENKTSLSEGVQMKHRSLGRTDRIFDALAATTMRNFIFMNDLDTNVTKWSMSAVEYFDLPGQYIYDTKSVWEALIHPDDRAAFNEDIDAVFAGTKKYHDIEYRIKNKKGEYVVCTCRGLITKKDNGDPEFFVGTVINHGVIDGVDPVTGLHNINEYTKFVSAQLKDKQVFSIISIGISVFNNINMMYGYAYGNAVLKDFAVKIKNIIGGRALLFRLDGAKFAICSTEYDRQELVEVYEKIRKIASDTVGPDEVTVPLKLYGGAIVCNHVGADVDVIKGSVDYAMERSKDDGQGNLMFFNDEIKNGDKNKLMLYGTIHKSVMNNMEGFFMNYQPVADAKTGELVGMEALLRWQHKDFGVVPPTVFIPWLEMEPCFFEVGNWIIERALTEGLEIRKLRPDFMVNVNISAMQLENREFRNAVKDILYRTKFPPQYFCMELTERCKFINIELLKSEMEYFRSLGIKIAIDDFGTGNATLNLLAELPVDELKVDMSFVKGIQDSKKNQVLVQTIVSCANALGYNSCIEGVEDEELCNYLHRYDSTYYQGYHFSKPVSIEEFKKLL